MVFSILIFPKVLISDMNNEIESSIGPTYSHQSYGPDKKSWADLNQIAWSQAKKFTGISHEDVVQDAWLIFLSKFDHIRSSANYMVNCVKWAVGNQLDERKRWSQEKAYVAPASEFSDMDLSDYSGILENPADHSDLDLFSKYTWGNYTLSELGKLHNDHPYNVQLRIENTRGLLQSHLTM